MKEEHYNEENIATAYAKCVHIARAHYENFPVATFILSPQQRNHFAAIYAFARLADDAADEGHISVEERRAVLLHLEQQLRECYQGTPHDLLFIALKDTIQTCHIPLQLFLDLLHAFHLDLTINQYQTFDELLKNYCHYSANPVGRLVLSIFNLNTAPWQHASDQICSALQLTNFWQDISIDLEKGRVYIPQDELQLYNVSEEDLKSKKYSENFVKLMENLTTRTQKLFLEGKPILNIPNPKLRLYLWMTYLGGLNVLEKIKRKQYRVLDRRITLNKLEKLFIFIRAIILACVR